MASRKKKKNSGANSGSNASQTSNDAPATQPDSAPATEARRNFVAEVGSIVLGAIVGLIPLGAGLFTFLNPLAWKKKVPKAYQNQGDTGPDGHIRITALEALKPNGPPQRFLVIDDKADAWNYMPNQPVGAVYLQRIQEEGQDEVVRVFNTTCPHAGCSVSCDGSNFVCPCHSSSFTLDGKKRAADSGRDNPSPRDLDSLEYQVVDGEIWVEFQNFYIGKHDKIAKS